MKSGRGVVYLDPYEWLPGYGENAVALIYQGSDLSVRIEYDDEEGDAAYCYRELHFKHACEFRKAAFPGATHSGCELELGDGRVSTLNIYPESEVAKAWNLHFNNLFRFNHYTLWFTAENVSVEVIACDVELSDVVYVPRGVS
ncbi:hypothetical protein GKQ23_12945 [Erwinia sp. E602]|uniref:hypothetical protein n=1 Tax=Erwinia sp. E602 TaxID=2675378 RepID=UPI001BAE421C|nr:hypothetical protein [Erwinia sp. E602]QUG75846.1 hypothetical protein GKQ23_12945 [Erwinia sp. E602]